MVYKGTVRGNVVELPPDVHLPDGLEVTVQLATVPAHPPSPIAAQPEIRNGVPLFPHHAARVAPGLELVNALRDELP